MQKGAEDMKAKRLLGFILALTMFAACGCTKTEVEKPVDEPKPKYTVREGFVTDLEDIIKMEYTNNEVTITLDNIDGAWFHADDHDVWLNQSILMSLEKTAGQMAFLEEVKTVTSLADYGLEKPAYTITMENEDGFVVKLYIGNAVEEDQSCYVAVDDKEKVYKVSNALLKYLEFDKEKLIAVEVDPMQYLKDQEEPTEDSLLGDVEEVPLDTAPESTPGEDAAGPDEEPIPEEGAEQPTE
jgi:hypothetical protein